MKKRILSLCLAFVLCLTLMPTAAFADDPARVDFVIQNFNSGNVHFLGDSWNEVFQFQTVNSNGTISHLPIVVRTDTDALVFDGWYTEKTGGEKVTTDTVFDSYTILYDHWVDAPETTDTVIDSIKINNSSTTNGYTILDYTNASAVPTVTKSGATLVNAVRGGRDFSIFKGVASIEPAFTDNDRMDKNADYTVVTEILLNNGYRINKDTLFSAQNGIIFRKQFFGMVNGEPVSVDNEWFAGATSVKIFISLHGEATTPYFYVQPESGSAENGTPYKYSFEITSKPRTMVLQTKAGNDTWVDLCEVDYTSGVYQTPAYNDKTMTFRLVVTGWANGGPSYTGPVQSNEFTVTWGENTPPPVDPPVENRFVTQPQDATLEPEEDYNATWSLNFEPVSVKIQYNKDGEWVHYVDATATGVTILGLTGGATRTFRVVAYNDYGTAYSDEFTVTWTENTTPPAPLTALSATITAPVAGVTPVWTATAGSSDYTAEVYWWYLYGSDGTFEKLLQNTDTFEAGKKYAAIVRFTPASGIEMSRDATATINGLSGKYGGFDTVTGALAYFVDFTVPEAPPAPLTALSATITAPVAGATPVWTATAGSSDYTAEVYWWYLYGSDGTFEKLLQNTDTFEAGKKYAAIVRFTPASGIEMSRDATATINGLSGKYGGFDTVTGALAYFVDFTVPEAQPTTYTVSFNMNGHGTAPATQTVNEGSKATKPANDPTAEGWTFGGWYADATFNVAFDFNTAITADTTIYAKWTENSVTPPVPTTYTVSFNMNGHGTQVADQTVEDGNKATKPADPTASGWTFGGWYADATFSARFDFNTAITANTTIYAKWTENTTPPAPTYTIIAGMGGEWTKGSTTGLSFTSDAPFAKFDSVQVDGSTIAAANYTAEEGSTKITLAPAYLETLGNGSHSIRIVSNDGSASTNFTVKAAAQPPVPAKYTVSFNMNGHGTQITAQTVESGSKATKPADPKASGYTFGGWYADATFSTKFDFNTAITANTTVYAKWTKNSAAPADPTSPQTGDTSNMFLWIALLLVSGGALVGTTVYGRKKKYNAK